MAEKITYQTQGTCCQIMDVVIENDIIQDIAFYGGCHGNLQGIAKLVIGMNINTVLERLKGIRCGSKTTSCPDQLAQCLEQYIASKQGAQAIQH